MRTEVNSVCSPLLSQSLPLPMTPLAPMFMYGLFSQFQASCKHHFPLCISLTVPAPSYCLSQWLGFLLCLCLSQSSQVQFCLNYSKNSLKRWGPFPGLLCQVPRACIRTQLINWPIRYALC